MAYHFGWRPGLPDIRDLRYEDVAEVHSLAKLPPQIDLRSKLPTVYDQKQLGSCVANATAGMAEFLLIKESKPAFVPSRLFIYYNARAMEGSVGQDAGASVRDGVKSVNQMGAPPESLWWYNTDKFAVKPGANVYAAARQHRFPKYASLNNTVIEQLKSCLSSGNVFVFGFTVYSSFMTQAVATTGVMPMPGWSDTVEGGHAVVAVGYDDTKQVIIVRNSWGTGWGDYGYFYMPYTYVTHPNLADDFWTVAAIS